MLAEVCRPNAAAPAARARSAHARTSASPTPRPRAPGPRPAAAAPGRPPRRRARRTRHGGREEEHAPARSPARSPVAPRARARRRGTWPPPTGAASSAARPRRPGRPTPRRHGARVLGVGGEREASDGVALVGPRVAHRTSRGTPAASTPDAAPVTRAAPGRAARPSPRAGQRHHARGVEPLVRHVVVPLDVVQVHRLAEGRALVQVAGVAPQVGVVHQAPQVALEVPHVHRVEARERGEQPHVGLGELAAHEVALPGEPRLQPVEPREERRHGRLVGGPARWRSRPCRRRCSRRRRRARSPRRSPRAAPPGRGRARRGGGTPSTASRGRR
jgi:hypothetical protein